MKDLQTFAGMSALTFMATAPAFAAQHYGQDKAFKARPIPPAIGQWPRQPLPG